MSALPNDPLTDVLHNLPVPQGLPTGMRFAVEYIAPERARELLERNQNPRKLRSSRVEAYKADMVAGKWVLGTSSIAIDADGNLRDGQHRLEAAHRAGVGFWTLVLYGATDDVIDNLDQGLKRTNSDVLRAHGEMNQHGLAAAINVCRAWDRGEIFYPKRTTPSQAMEWLEENPGIRQAVSAGSNLASAPLRMRISSSSALVYRIRTIDGAQAHVFVQQLLHGIGLAEDDAAFRLRQWLLTKSVTAYGRPSREMELALGVKAWNNFITGKPTKILRWARGSRNEDFPALLQADGTPYPFPEIVARNRHHGDADE